MKRVRVVVRASRAQVAIRVRDDQPECARGTAATQTQWLPCLCRLRQRRNETVRTSRGPLPPASSSAKLILVNRELVVLIVIGSILWAVTGVSVLAVAVHEHSQHSEFHDHLQAFKTALHGHDHDGEAERDHEPTAPSSASRAPVVVQPLALPSYPCSADIDPECPTSCDEPQSGRFSDEGPPPYLILGVFLT